jgi:hypothetical protein
VIGGVLVDGGSFRLGGSGAFPNWPQPYDGFHGMVFSEESTVGAFLLRARREGLRDFGACMSPHTAWLILQGIETLPLRMARTCATPQGGRVPGRQPDGGARGLPLLEGHPSHALAQKLLPRGAGSVFSFDLKGSREQGKAFIEALKIFSHLANVGDCRSLVIHPASTTHFRMDDDALAAAGITQGTIRLSIGLEDADDLIDDLKRALKVAKRQGPDHELLVNGPQGLLLHRRQALRPGPALRGVHPRRAQRPQRLGAAKPLPRQPRLERAGGRPARPLQERRPDAPASVEARRGLHLALLDAAGVQRAALVGHSWGSLIALEAAARLKERISHLVLVGTAFPMKVRPRSSRPR